MKPIASVVARIALAALGGAAVLAGRALPAQAQPPLEQPTPQPTPGDAAVWGAIADQFAQPVAGAEVLLATAGRTLTTRSGEAGTYRLDSLTPGAQRFRVRRIGYLPLTVSIDVTRRDMESHDFTLVKLPLSLDPTLVQTPDGELRADFDGFATRRATGAGAFIDRAAIDELRPTTSTDLMRAMKSFRVLAAGNGGYRLVAASGESDAPCPVRFLVDGFPYTPVDGLDDFDPEHVGALEVYGAGEAPPAMDAGADGCGTIVVWLRR